MTEEVVTQINGGIMINIDVSVKKSYNVWNPASCNCENGKNSASIIDDSVIMSDETIDKKVPRN